MEGFSDGSSTLPASTNLIPGRTLGAGFDAGLISSTKKKDMTCEGHVFLFGLARFCIQNISAYKLGRLQIAVSGAAAQDDYKPSKYHKTFGNTGDADTPP